MGEIVETEKAPVLFSGYTDGEIIQQLMDPAITNQEL